jgi:hypothetical protein
VSEGKYFLEIDVVVKDDARDVIAVELGRTLLAIIDFAQILVIFGKELLLTDARL